MLTLIILAVILGGCITWGPGWIVHALIWFAIASIVGSWLEHEIVARDELIRQKAGLKADVSAKHLGEFAKNSCRTLGLVLPVIPLICAGVAVYCHVSTSRHARRLSTPPQQKLHPALERPGRMVLR